MPKGTKLTREQIDDAIRRVHGDLVVIDHSSYKNARTPARFIDVEFGEWWAQPGSVFRGSGHQQRFIEKQRLSVDDVERRIKHLHNDTVAIDRASYVHTYKKCTFIDVEFGAWQAYPHNVLNGSTHPKRGLLHRKQTWTEVYGVDNPFKSESVQDKATSSRRRVARFCHWRSGVQLVCVGSYEVAFVNWCNQNHIDFDWQIWHETPWKQRYRIDAYIKSGVHADTWVEIKGFFRDNDSRRKWEWFHETHPNSELWNQQRLIELGVL